MIGAARAIGTLALLCVCATGGAAPRATLVILPPEIKGGDAKTPAAAELLCDRLAGKLGGIDGVKVVDRTQIDRVLAERKLTSRPAGPALSYDAMVRVRLDAAGPVWKLTLSVVDLSMGNVAAAKTYPWAGPEDPKVLADMAGLCASAVKAVATRPAGTIKVRIVTLIPDRVARLEPLRKRLQQTFESALTRSPKTVLVRHLEAATAKEESLLILLGHSRLPGGRRFSPQADATVELQLTEADAVGKTFEQTVVDIRCRLARGGQAGQWSQLKGTVAEWDAAMASAWRAVSGALSGADPAAASDFLKEMAVRRRQAAAEIEKLRSLRATGYSNASCSGGNLVVPGTYDRIARIASTAAKLDPTSEEAVFVATKFNFLVRRQAAWKSPAQARTILRPSLAECIHFLRTFHGNAAWRYEVVCVAQAAMHQVLAPGHCPHGPRIGALKLPPMDRQLLDVLVRTYDLVLKAKPVFCNQWEVAECVRALYEHMRASRLPPESARRWRDRKLKALDDLYMAGLSPRTGEPSHRGLLIARYVAADYAVTEGRPDEARRLLNGYMDAVTIQKDSRRRTNAAVMRMVAKRLKDGKLLERIDEWTRRKPKPPPAGMTPFAIRWPRYGSGKDAVTVKLPTRRLPLKARGQAATKMTLPLGRIGRRMYLIASGFSSARSMPSSPDGSPQKARRGHFGYLPLDARGAATTEQLVLLPLPRHSQIQTWPRVNAAAVVDGKLCVGTYGSGLMVFDPKAETWKAYGPPQGLPHWCVSRVFPLDAPLAVCAGTGWKSLAYTVDVRTDKIRLLRRGEKYVEFPVGIWKHRGKWRGAVTAGIIEDVLADKYAVRPWPPDRAYRGWGTRFSPNMPPYASNTYPAGAMARCGGRRFICLGDGLWEIDDLGRVLKHWSTDTAIRLGRHPHHVSRRLLMYRSVPLPGILPPLHLVGGNDRHLVFGVGVGFMVFEPGSETWYGPVDERFGNFLHLVTGHRLVDETLWYHTSFTGLNCLAVGDIIAAARQTGRVATTGQLKARLRGAIEDAPDIDRAKFAYCFREFDKAKALLKDILAHRPDDPEALVLLSMIHDPCALDDRPAALAYQKRLAELPDNPRANLAGLFMRVDLQRRGGDLDEALKMGRGILSRFPLAKTWRQGIEVLNRNTVVRIRLRDEKRKGDGK